MSEADEATADDGGVISVDYRDPDAPALFARSLRQSGFGVLRNHPIPQDLVEQIYAEWLAFFDGPDAMKYLVGERHDGYFPPDRAETAKTGKTRDLKEYFHIYSWGRYPAEVSDAARRYYDLAGDLASELLGWVEDNTPADVRARFSMPLPRMMDGSTGSLFRILRYPPLTGEEDADAVRAHAHEDINLLTVLPAANERGLQLLTDAGDWVDVPSDFGTLVINTGDMLQEASGGYYRSTTHRVINPTGEAAKRSRVAIPMFLQPRPDVVLSERHTAGSYLAERLAELARNDR
ncbi:MAG: isopenicillin N synthase family oxygenase [Rhizobiales bacterium]|nr:isopenicillin N synthase family oxygenase [Hyphomicrobiales bacterium]